MGRFWAGVLTVLTILIVSQPTYAAKRFALVIGNGAYPNLGVLKNPPSDAKLMARTLRGLGFEVIERIDANRKVMLKAIKLFGNKLEEAEKDAVGLFYYAGHGVQVRGENFLIPVNVDIQDEADVNIESVSADAVQGNMAFAGNSLNIIIMDACRNNPFKRSFRSASRGLARMDASKGTLIAYATSPGDVAADGKGANSPYTEALVKAMRTPGINIERVFKEVRNQVVAATDSAQVPWEASSLTGGDFFFKAEITAKITLTPVGSSQLAALPPAFDITPMEDQLTALKNVNIRSEPNAKSEKITTLNKGTSVEITGRTRVKGANWYEVALADGGSGFVYGKLLGSATKEPARSAPAVDRETVFWQSISASEDAGDYEAYIRQYPDGSFVELARVKAKKLTKTASVIPTKSATSTPSSNASGEAAYWEAVKDGSMEDIQGYMKNYPNGQFELVATMKLGKFKQGMETKRLKEARVAKLAADTLIKIKSNSWCHIDRSSVQGSKVTHYHNYPAGKNYREQRVIAGDGSKMHNKYLGHWENGDSPGVVKFVGDYGSTEYFNVKESEIINYRREGGSFPRRKNDIFRKCQL